MNRKIIIITVIILGVLATAFGIYFAWQKSQEILTPPANRSQTLPTIGNQKFQPTPQNIKPVKLQIISSQAVFDSWVEEGVVSSSVASGTTTLTSYNIFYLGTDGKIFKVPETNLSGGAMTQDEVLSSNPISNIQSARSSPDGKMVLIKSGVLSSPQFLLFNAHTKVWQQLPGISSAAFSPDSKRIVYLGNLENGGSILAMKDLVGTKPKVVKILTIFENDFDLQWISQDTVLLLSKPSSEYEGQIWSLSIKNKTLKLVDSGAGLSVNLSGDGRLGIRFKIGEGQSPLLNLIDAGGNVLANLDFSTLPDKCFVSQSKIYCAIPQGNNAVKAPVLPDDYLKRAVHFNDFIYGIDTNKNSFSPFFTGLSPSIDATHLMLAGSKLLFINRYDNKLYSLDLSSG